MMSYAKLKRDKLIELFHSKNLTSPKAISDFIYSNTHRTVLNARTIKRWMDSAEGSGTDKPQEANVKEFLRGLGVAEENYCQYADFALPAELTPAISQEKATTDLNPTLGSQTSWDRIVAEVLPSNHARLLGRKQELEEASRILQVYGGRSSHGASRGLLIAALGGMGKTALAQELCLSNELRNRYDRIIGMTAKVQRLFYPSRHSSLPTIRKDTRRPACFTDFLLTVAKQLDLNTPSLRDDADLSTEIRSRLSGKRTLIVLDNLETVEQLAGALDQLFSTFEEPSQTFLITAREVPEELPETIRLLSLKPLCNIADCRDLVLDALETDAKRKYESHETINSIIQIAQGLPLALRLLAGMLNNRGHLAIADLQRQLKVSGAKAIDDEYLNILCKYIFDERFLESIGEDGIELLQLIADHDDGIEKNELEDVSEMASRDFEIFFGRLQSSMAVYTWHDPSPEYESPIVTMHSVTRAYFRISDPAADDDI